MKESLIWKIKHLHGFKYQNYAADFFETKFFVSDEFIESLFTFQLAPSQLFVILEGIYNLNTEEEIKLCINPKFNCAQISTITDVWHFSGVHVNDLKPYAREDISADIMCDIPHFIKAGLTKEQINLCINETNSDKRRLIFGKLVEGHTTSQVKVYSKSGLSTEQSCQLAMLFDMGLSVEEVSTYVNDGYSFEKLCEIVAGYKAGLTSEDVSKYANSKLKVKQMRRIRESLVLKKADV